eukprot:TRINITY_DN2011_c0_g1_i5.p1 TRINITY_DN2011_c0_g1~~TRINITY_DN2011_c0_g1_i5.p1  ORF type:complete len:475 (+),score=90.13 TRINITY_DN2011_c0_g1_i5:51-1427(+)
MGGGAMRGVVGIVVLSMVSCVGADLEGLVGCFADNAENPGLDLEATKSLEKGVAIVKACKAACTDGKRGPFAYFGVSNDRCWCTNHFKYAASPSESCGPGKGVSVYETGHPTRKGSKTATDYFAVYIGCYKDKSPGRIFPQETQKDDEELTVMSCVAHCISHDTPYAYMALQDGNQCFCGKELSDKYGKSDNCNAKQCAGGTGPNPRNVVGGPEGFCGGPFANQVYQLLPRIADKPKPGDSVNVGTTAGGALVTTSGMPPNCGVPGAVLVAFLLITSTLIGSHGFFTSMVLTSVLSQATASVFIGTLLSDTFVLVVSALLGHILPDSKFFSTYYTKLISAVLCVGVGMVQVSRSFEVAGKDQSDKRDEFRVALSEVSRPAQKHDAEGDVVLDTSQDGPSVVYRAFTATVLSQWGGLFQLTIITLATTLHVNSVIVGGFAAVVCTLHLCCGDTAFPRKS